MPLVKSSNEYK